MRSLLATNARCTIFNVEPNADVVIKPMVETARNTGAWIVSHWAHDGGLHPFDGNDQVLVEVRDAGTGIDPAEMERLFEAFYTTKAEGIAMGLSISRSIIEPHGGRLWATANEPHGAVFQFSLPVEAPRSYPPAAEDS